MLDAAPEGGHERAGDSVRHVGQELVPGLHDPVAQPVLLGQVELLDRGVAKTEEILPCVSPGPGSRVHAEIGREERRAEPGLEHPAPVQADAAFHGQIGAVRGPLFVRRGLPVTYPRDDDGSAPESATHERVIAQQPRVIRRGQRLDDDGRGGRHPGALRLRGRSDGGACDDDERNRTESHHELG